METPDRFSLQAAIALALAVFVPNLVLTLLPLEFMNELQRWGPPMPMDYGTPMAFAFLYSTIVALAAGILAFAAWRLVLLPAGAVAFMPGALAGAAVGLCLTFGLTYLFGLRTFEEEAVIRQAPVPLSEMLIGMAVLFVVLAIPATLLTGFVGGMVASTQRAMLADSEPERRLPVHPPR